MQAIWIATFLQKLCTSLFIYAHLLILVRRQILRKHSCHILKKNCLIETFPNVAIILRIYLTLPVANTEGELSFSAMKRVKNYLRSSLTPDHVCDFCIIAIEKRFTKSMSFEDIIDKFAAAKCRKHQLYYRVRQKDLTHLKI